MMKTNRKRITVETTDANGELIKRRVSVPADALTEGRCIPANQVGTGVYETDTYVSPRGVVIARMHSQWDNGRGGCQGTYYQQITDAARLAEEFGVEPKQIPEL